MDEDKSKRKAFDNPFFASQDSLNTARDEAKRNQTALFHFISTIVLLGCNRVRVRLRTHLHNLLLTLNTIINNVLPRNWIAKEWWNQALSVLVEFVATHLLLDNHIRIVRSHPGHIKLIGRTGHHRTRNNTMCTRVVKHHELLIDHSYF